MFENYYRFVLKYKPLNANYLKEKLKRQSVLNNFNKVVYYCAYYVNGFLPLKTRL